MALTDALLSAFAMFSLTSPSRLAWDKERVEGNVQTIYGIEHAPWDTSRRERIDPVFPEALRPVFQDVFRQLQRGKALDPMLCRHGASWLALDGTGSCSSKTMHCTSCLHKGHRNGSMTSYHHMLGAAILHPDLRDVIPLMPAPIVPHAGTAKNAGERQAAKRFLVTRRQDHPHRTPASSLQRVSVPRLPTSRRCMSTVTTLFSGAKKAIMLLSSHRGRQLRTPGA